MGHIITDLKDKFLQGDICLRFIYVNVGVYLLCALVSVLFKLFNLSSGTFLLYLECPADIWVLLKQPWSLLTYMFMHSGVLHLLFNMLWLYCFGRFFLYEYSSRHFRGLYLLGGIAGALLYVLAFNLFPYFAPMISRAWLVGASASVLAVVVATAVSMPEQQLNFIFLGPVRLKYVALIMVVTDLLFITSENGGGHIAHLGGALAGWLFASGIKSGSYDVTAWINGICDWVVRICTPSVRVSKKPKTRMNVSYGARDKDYRYNEEKKKRSDEIDRILDKVKQSGYEGLTAEEKRTLFDASQK